MGPGVVGVVVEGAQYTDSGIDHHVSLYDATSKELTADGARQLAAALITAADALERPPN